MNYWLQGFQKDRISQFTCNISDKERKDWLMTVYLFPPLCQTEKVLITPPAGQQPDPYWPQAWPCLYLCWLRCPQSWDHWPLTTPYLDLARALPFHVPRPPAATALARQSRIWWLRPNLERIHICHEHYIMRTHLLAEIENHNFIWNKYIINCIAFELTRKMLIESLIKSQMYILEMLTSCGGWR